MSRITSFYDRVGVAVLLGLFAIFILGSYGYVANLVKLVRHVNDPLTALEIARGVGLFAVPLGVILGFL